MPDLTAVRNALREQRIEDMGLDPDPVAAYQRSGYGQRIIEERIGGTPASWGS
jgi:L-rhamnose isomerase/sugar isomerase